MQKNWDMSYKKIFFGFIYIVYKKYIFIIFIKNIN